MKQSLIRKTNWLWQNAERILIVLFLATFSWNIRKVFLTPYSFLNGGFNEYTTPNISWADLLMLSIIFIYTIKWLYSQLTTHPSSANIAENNNTNNKSSVIRCITYVSRETLLLMIFLLWIGLSVFWSQEKSIAIYRFASLLEIAFFAYIAIKSLKDSKWINIAFFALIANGLFQSILGIAQFVHNKSLGIHWLGESILGPDFDGVAKIIIDGEKHIRAYGTFPHPNILAGFLIIPILILFSMLIEKMKVNQIIREGDSRETFNTKLSYPSLIVFLLFTLIGFTLTFSRSAFFGLGAGLVTLFTLNFRPSHRKFRLTIILGSLISLFSGYLIVSHSNSNFLLSTQSFHERNLYISVSREIISENPLTGSGLGQFVFKFFSLHPNLPGWQYQPVHNMYLLITSELGVVGLVLSISMIVSYLYGYGIFWHTGILSKLTYNYIYCIVISFFIISLFDHYFWDIKQGMMILAIPFVLARACTRHYEKIPAKQS